MKDIPRSIQVHAWGDLKTLLIFFSIFILYYCNRASIFNWKLSYGYAQGSLSHSPVLLFISTFPGVPVIPNKVDPSLAFDCTLSVYFDELKHACNFAVSIQRSWGRLDILPFFEKILSTAL